MQSSRHHSAREHGLELKRAATVLFAGAITGPCSHNACQNSLESRVV